MRRPNYTNTMTSQLVLYLAIITNITIGKFLTILMLKDERRGGGPFLLLFLRIIISPVCSVVASSADMMFSVQEDKRAGQVCKTKNKKQLKEVEDAQLAAHR